MTKLQRIMLFFLLFGTMLIFGLIENIKGVSYPLIKAEFDASWEQQGFMVSMLSLSYVSFSIAAGIFLGRFGIKPAFLSGFAALTLGLFSVFFMPGFFSAAAALFLVFAGFGFFEVGINALASRTFTSKAAVLMNMLHAFYGIGAIIGPKAAGLLANNAGFGWRYIYLLCLPLSLMLFIPGIFIKFPEEKHSRSAVNEADKTGGPVKRKSFFDALRSPMVWFFSLTLGLAVVIEMNSANWGPLYFQDVYGMDPTTGGAAFLSAFFIVFTLSRLVCGAFVERIGYIRSLTGLACIILLIFIAGFCLGERGIYILPALGFFVALLWPTIMALAIVRFGDDAPVMSSAMIAIGGILNAGVQFLVGLTNRFFGPAWGYRSSLLYTALLIGMLILLRKKLNQTREVRHGF
ncbi:MAG: MFS transporter [Treponema sp.]|nr:MFS transporter [Treponema sp.]